MNEEKEVELNANEREAKGFYDEELLAECMAILEYATYHDGRYAQVDRSKNFQIPAQKLVGRLGKRLNRKSYEGFGS